MARKQETWKYGEGADKVEITVRAMGGLDGTKLGIRLADMLGPSVIGIFGGVVDAASGAMAGRMIFEKLTPDAFEATLLEMLQGAQLKNAKNEFDDVTRDTLNEAFSGNVGGLYKLAADCVRLNFRNFLQGLGMSSASSAKVQAVLTKAAQKVMLPESE